MAVSADDVRHVAALARLALDEARVRDVAAELNTILVHMEALSTVDTVGVAEAMAGLAALPVRPDTGPPIPLARAPASFAPATRDGFFVVPRLETHEDDRDAEASS